LAPIGHAPVTAETRQGPERRLGSRSHVACAAVQGECHVLAKRKVAARFGAEEAVGDRTAKAAAREACIEKVTRSAVRNEHRVAAVMRQSQGLLERMLVAEASEIRVQRLDRGHAAQYPGEHIDASPTCAPGELRCPREVIPDGSGECGLIVDVGALVVVGSLIADAIEARRAAAIVGGLHRPGDGRHTCLPAKVTSIELVLDLLLDAADHEPLAVLGWKPVQAYARAPAEVLAVEKVGRGNAL